jgi:hypothetical protein
VFRIFGSDFCNVVLGSTFETAYPNALSWRLTPIAVTTTSDKLSFEGDNATSIVLLVPTVTSLVV